MKAIIINILILFLLAKNFSTHAQSREKNKYFLYNLGLGITTTTVGAVINKPQNMGYWECVKKSVWQGALGGVLQYSAKRMTNQIHQNSNYWWGLPSKLVHSAGVSICQNAAKCNKFGKYWVFDYGPLHANFHFNDGQFKFQPQFNLLFLYDVYYGLQKANIDLEKSLKLGVLTLSADREYFEYDNGRITTDGATYTRTIILAQKSERIYRAVAHEMIHVFQLDEHRVMNTYFKPLTSKIKSQAVNNIFKYVYIEFPFSSAFYGLAYLKEGNRNFYEREAGF